jgi:hypothetical protein
VMIRKAWKNPWRVTSARIPARHARSPNSQAV